MTEWTWQTWEAIRRADSRRTHAFNAAVNAMVAQPDLGAAISAYNQVMGEAARVWNEQCADAIALSEDPF